MTVIDTTRVTSKGQVTIPKSDKKNSPFRRGFFSRARFNVPT